MVTGAQMNVRFKEFEQTVRDIVSPYAVIFSVIVGGIIVVLFIGFITLLFTGYALVIDADNTKTTSYNSLLERVDYLQGVVISSPHTAQH